VQIRPFAIYNGFNRFYLRMVVNDGGNLNKSTAVNGAKKFDFFLSLELSAYIGRTWDGKIWRVWKVVLFVNFLTNITDFKNTKQIEDVLFF